MFNSFLKLKTNSTPINYFPKNNNYIIGMELYADSYACVDAYSIKKQKEKALLQKFWKVFVTSSYNSNNILG